MILVASTAMGLGLVRRLSPESLLASFDPIGPMSVRWGEPWTTKDWALWAIETTRSRYDYALPLFSSWPVTLLIFRMRKPRPRLARLMAQPGIVACITAADHL